MSGGAETFYGAQHGAGGVVGFYGTTPITQQTVTETVTTTATTTALATDVAAIHSALVALGLITE